VVVKLAVAGKTAGLSSPLQLKAYGSFIHRGLILESKLATQTVPFTLH